MQRLGEMQHVGQPALAVGEQEQPPAQLLLLQQCAHHRREAAVGPQVRVVMESFETLLPVCLVPAERFERCAVQPEQAGG